ncbi:unnamed protein product [Blepharisma stoltei]|uniref:Uncharacterized protein n=1 Tax=Blepharisma stoltei TaxID=1481888 RepID=A0AAU9J4E7_9CILI|nr:unnamed protein product [Blepharisma stoltei]
MKTHALLILSFLIISSAIKAASQRTIESNISPSFHSTNNEASFVKDQPNFIQLSSRTSEVENDNLFYRNKLAIVGVLTFLSVLLCFGIIQAANRLSKRKNAEYLTMKQNYKQYQGLIKFREFYRNYSKESLK